MVPNFVQIATPKMRNASARLSAFRIPQPQPPSLSGNPDKVTAM